MTNNKLSGKVAIVTGASRGIGAAIAQRLAANGAQVIVNFNSSQAEANEVVAMIQQAGGEAIAVKADLSDPDQIPELFDAAEKSFGLATLLVNNASVRGEMQSAPEVDLAHYERVFDANVRGPVLCMVEFAQRVGQASGRIVNISSGQARTAMPGAGMYAGSKGAIKAITRVFAADLEPHGITVNAVAPGATATKQFLAAVPEQVQQETVKNTALGRLGQPEVLPMPLRFCSQTMPTG